MWWECSECGERTEHDRAPSHCEGCGWAGVIFVAADGELDAPEAESRAALWINLGFERARSTHRALLA
jgi:hypothetical protein